MPVFTEHLPDRMPFGKFRGHLLTDIKGDYLFWGLETWDWTYRPALRAAVVAELRRRLAALGGTEEEGSPRGEEGPRPSAAAALPPGALRSWFRDLALRYHPDRGGSGEAMAALNNARDLLKEALARHGLPADF